MPAPRTAYGEGSISGCFAAGSVSATAEFDDSAAPDWVGAGGVVGTAGAKVSVSNCCVTGTVSGSACAAGWAIDGVVGLTQGEVSGRYAANAVSGKSNRYDVTLAEAVLEASLGVENECSCGDDTPPENLRQFLKAKQEGQKNRSCKVSDERYAMSNEAGRCETTLPALCGVANQHSGIQAAHAEFKNETGGRPAYRMNSTKNSKRMILIAVAAAVILCLIGFALASLTNRTGESRTEKEAEQIIGDYMEDLIGGDSQKAYYGEYSIDGIEQIENFIYATAQYHPNEGQGSVYLFILKEDSGKLSIVDEVQGNLPLSMGVELYKETFSNTTVVFGTVNDQLWFDLDGAPQKIDFTEIKALYSNGKEKTVKVNNFQSFFICIDGDVTIKEVLFLSGSEIVGKLSELPISENVMDDFNSSGSPYAP